MGEERYEQRVLETWPCGCREWYVETVVGDAVEWRALERREMCREIARLVEREERAELRVATALVEHGEHSPEYKRATIAHLDVLGKVAEHYNDGVPDVEVLGPRTQ